MILRSDLRFRQLHKIHFETEEECAAACAELQEITSNEPFAWWRGAVFVPVKGYCGSPGWRLSVKEGSAQCRY
jgi:hypothetical protein